MTVLFHYCIGRIVCEQVKPRKVCKNAFKILFLTLISKCTLDPIGIKRETISGDKKSD